MWLLHTLTLAHNCTYTAHMCTRTHTHTHTDSIVLGMWSAPSGPSISLLCLSTPHLHSSKQSTGSPPEKSGCPDFPQPLCLLLWWVDSLLMLVWHFCSSESQPLSSPNPTAMGHLCIWTLQEVIVIFVFGHKKSWSSLYLDITSHGHLCIWI